MIDTRKPQNECSVNAETFRHMCQKNVQRTLRLTHLVVRRHGAQMSGWFLLALAIILILWATTPFLFRGEPSTWTSRQKVLAWVFFGGPFLLGLFHRSLTKR